MGEGGERLTERPRPKRESTYNCIDPTIKWGWEWIERGLLSPSGMQSENEER